MMVKLRYSTLDFQSSVEFNCPQKKKKKKQQQQQHYLCFYWSIQVCNQCY